MSSRAASARGNLANSLTIEQSQRYRWGQLKDLPKMGALSLVKDGDNVLVNLGLGEAEYPELMQMLVVLSGIYLSLSWVGLSFFGPSFIG